MFSKVALTSFVLAAISVNALAVPAPRSPAPEPETWSEWGTNIGNYYANKYPTPDSVPGLPHYKREPSPEPETWSEWGTNIGNYYANKYGTPDSVPNLPRPWLKRESGAEIESLEAIVEAIQNYPASKREPETWSEWGTNIGNYYANKYSTPDAVPGLPHYKREPSPEPETWSEWGTNIGNYYANKYPTPDSVPGLPHYKREPSPEPETWSEWGTNIGNYYANMYGTPDSLPNLPRPWLKRESGTEIGSLEELTEAIQNRPASSTKREPETWSEWGTNIGNYYANKYSTPDAVPGLPHYKREPSPEPETWSEWGTNIGNYYANEYGTPDSVPNLPRPWLKRGSGFEIDSLEATVEAIQNHPASKREPETWSEWGTNIGNYYANKYSTPDAVPGLPHYKREPSPEPETWSEWGTNIGNHYADEYSSPDAVPGLPHYKREPSPEPETWGEWGSNIGNYYANKYGSPDQVPGLPRPWEKREPQTLAE